VNSNKSTGSVGILFWSENLDLHDIFYRQTLALELREYQTIMCENLRERSLARPECG